MTMNMISTLLLLLLQPLLLSSLSWCQIIRQNLAVFQVFSRAQQIQENAPRTPVELVPQWVFGVFRCWNSPAPWNKWRHLCKANTTYKNQRRHQKLKCGYAECEAQTAKSGGGFLEKRKWAPSHQLGDRIWYILGFEKSHQKLRTVRIMVFVNWS